MNQSQDQYRHCQSRKVTYSVKRVRRAHIEHLRNFYQEAQNVFFFVGKYNTYTCHQLQKVLMLELLGVWLQNLKDFLIIGGNAYCEEKKQVIDADLESIFALFEETKVYILLPVLLKYTPERLGRRLYITKEDYYELYLTLLTFWDALPAQLTIDFAQLPSAASK